MQMRCKWTIAAVLLIAFSVLDAGRAEVDATFEIFEAVHVAGAAAEDERNARAPLGVKVPPVVGVATGARVHRQTAHRFTNQSHFSYHFNSIQVHSSHFISVH